MTDPQSVTVADEMRSRRAQIGLTQDDLAARLGVSRRYVCSVELGERPPPPWYRLAMISLAEQAITPRDGDPT